MKIQSLENIQKYNYNTPNIKHSETTSANVLKNDVFIKSQSNIPFTGNQLKFAEKFTPFVDDIKKYILNSPDLDFIKIEQILKKYSPTTRVNNFKELPQDANICPFTCAYMKDMLNFNTLTNEIVRDNKEIYIKMPDKITMEERLNFLQSVVHEVTHVFQEESPDRISKVSFFNEYLKDKTFDDDVIKNISIMPKAYKIAEYNIYDPLYSTLRKTSEMPLPINNDSPELLDGLYRHKTGMPLQVYIKRVLDATVEKLQRESGQIDESIIKKYIVFIAEKEREAYSKALNVLKETLNIKCKTDLDLRVRLLELFTKTEVK